MYHNNYMAIIIKYWMHHNNDIAFLSIVLRVLLLCYVEVWADVQETSMGSVSDPVVSSGAHISVQAGRF